MDYKKFILPLIASIFLSFILYGNTIAGQFVHDDVFFVDRAELRDIKHLPKVWVEPYLPYNDQGAAYRPLTVFTFALNFIIFGESPVSFHITNIVLNGIVVFLVFLLTFNLFQNKTLALFSALFFAFLPIHTESVSFIKARDEILPTLFIIFSLLIFIKAIREEKIRYGLVFISSLVLFLGFLSKETGLIALPIFLMVYLILKKARFPEIIKIGFLFTPSLITYLIMRYIALGEVFARDYVYFIFDPLRYIDLYARVLTSFKIAFIYLSKIFVPINLSATYSYNQLELVKSPFQSWEVIPGILLLILLFILFLHPRTRKTPISFGAGFFLVTYSIYSKLIIQVSEIMGERWMYLPTVGLSILTGYLVYKIFSYKKIYAYLLLVFILVSYSWIILERNQIYLSKESYAKSLVRDAPKSAFSHHALAKVYYDQGKIKEARREAISALRIYEDYAPLLQLTALISFQEGNFNVSEASIRKAIESRPGLPENYQIYALVLAKTGRYKESLENLKMLPQRRISNPGVRFLYALNYYKLGEKVEARRYFDWDNSKTDEEKIKMINEF